MLVVVVVVLVLVLVDDDIPGGGGGKCYCFAADVVRLAPWSLWVLCGYGPGRCVTKQRLLFLDFT